MRVDSVEVGDEVGRGVHPPISGRTEVPRPGDRPRGNRDAGERVKGEDLDRSVVPARGIVEDRNQAFLGAGDPIGGVHGGEQAFAERGLFASS
jgi:hypothetical protein